jgi:hypothetical protein
MNKLVYALTDPSFRWLDGPQLKGEFRPEHSGPASPHRPLKRAKVLTSQFSLYEKVFYHQVAQLPIIIG